MNGKVAGELSEKFFAHVGECEWCRAVVESFYAEAPMPHHLCPVGRAILDELKALMDGKETKE